MAGVILLIIVDGLLELGLNLLIRPVVLQLSLLLLKLMLGFGSIFET